MALVLSMTPGKSFYVDETKFTVTDVLSETRFVLRRDDTDESWVISDLEATEIMPEVFASAGERLQPQAARVALDAPREIRILRAEMKEADGA